jgi:hypothetical protein
MNIFFIRKSEFLNHVDNSSFEKKFKSDKRNCEYTLGHFLAEFVAKKFYSLDDIQILEDNPKPKFKDKNLNFSISHSKDIISVCFDENYDVGFDVEFINENRDLKGISKYLKLPQNLSILDFYQYWTSYEAKYKSKNKYLTTFIFEKNYMCSISSFSPDIRSKLKIYEASIPKNSVSPSELINLKLVKESKKNEKTVEIQEISTASLDFLPPLALKIE